MGDAGECIVGGGEVCGEDEGEEVGGIGEGEEAGRVLSAGNRRSCAGEREEVSGVGEGTGRGEEVSGALYEENGRSSGARGWDLARAGGRSDQSPRRHETVRSAHDLYAILLNNERFCANRRAQKLPSRVQPRPQHDFINYGGCSQNWQRGCSPSS